MLKVVVSLVLTLLLAACGGGRDAGPPPEAAAPASAPGADTVAPETVALPVAHDSAWGRDSAAEGRDSVPAQGVSGVGETVPP